MAMGITFRRIAENLPHPNDMNSLVDEPSRQISRIYQYPWIGDKTTDNTFSALDLRNKKGEI